MSSKKYEIPKKLSISGVRCLLNEPDQFYRQYILKIPSPVPERIRILRECLDKNSLPDKPHYLNIQIQYILEDFQHKKSRIAQSSVPVSTMVQDFLIEGRIDHVTHDQRLVSYKFSTPPSKKRVEEGDDPKLPLLVSGYRGEVKGIEYWYIKGYGEHPIEVVQYPLEVVSICIENLAAKLKALLEK